MASSQAANDRLHLGRARARFVALDDGEEFDLLETEEVVAGWRAGVRIHLVIIERSPDRG